jgi:hypothetical protein
MKNRIEDAEKPWTDQEGKIINVDQCINACFLAGSLFLQQLEFNPRIKENEHARSEYERSRIIMNYMKENYERIKAVLEIAGKKPKFLMPKAKRLTQ